MWVLDASVLVKLFLSEARSDEFTEWFGSHTSRGEPMRAPQLLWSEVGRVVQREFPQETPEARARIHAEALVGVALSPPELARNRVWKMCEAGLKFYDAEYVALAAELGETLVTADRRMLETAADHGVGTMSWLEGP